MLDLSQFPELKTKTILGLGEMAHGSGGLHQLASELFKSAVTVLGSRTFGLEAPMGIVERINKKLAKSSSTGLVKSDLSELYPVWRSNEILELLNWIHEFNQRAEPTDQEIRFIGYDVRLPVYEFEEAVKWAVRVGGHDTAVAELKGKSLADIREIEMLSVNGRASEAVPKVHALSAAIENLAQDPRAEGRIRFVLKRLQAWSKVYQIWSGTGKMEPAYAERDRHMAWLLQELVGQRAESGPVVILAHLNHLLYDNFAVANSRAHVIAGPVLGHTLHKALGAKYALIGLFAAEVELANATEDPQRFVAQSDSIESQLSEHFGSLALIRSSALPKNLAASVRVGNVEPKGSPLLLTYSDYHFTISEQMDYLVTTKFAKTEKPF